MKKFLFGLGASLVASTSAHAQQNQPNPYARQNPNAQTPTIQIAPYQMARNYVLVAPALPRVSAAEGVRAVAGKPDVFTLKRGRYDAKELMQALVAKAGGKAVFVEGFKSAPLDLFPGLQGTAPELLAKMADYGVAAGKVGPDWVFVPVQPKAQVSIPLFTQNLQRIAPNVLPGLRILPSPKRDEFNLHPNPGQNLSPDATPFEFNGDRLYFTPLSPKTR